MTPIGTGHPPHPASVKIPLWLHHLLRQTDCGLQATGTTLLQQCPPRAPMGASESIEQWCLLVRGRPHVPFIVPLVTQIPLKVHPPILLGTAI